MKTPNLPDSDVLPSIAKSIEAAMPAESRR